MTDASTSKNDPGLNLAASLAGDSTPSKLLSAKIIPLKAPDSRSNWPDWEYQMLSLLEFYKVDYALKEIPPAKRPLNWESDSKAICTLISQVVEPPNFRYTRLHRGDAAKTWEALRSVHCDSSAGGRMYWLRMISTSKMESDDMLAHIDEVAKVAERLDSLVTPGKPLTVNEIHATALINSLPADWMSCVSSLMNQPQVTAEQVAVALKSEYLRRKTHDAEAPVSTSSAKPKASNQHSSSKPRSRPNRPPRDNSRHCNFCNVDGHDLNNCYNSRRILDEHKANQRSRANQGDSDKRQGSQAKPAARAGRTSAATLGRSSQDPAENEESDYSGSELEVSAGNAVASLSASFDSPTCGDANIDSGCSLSMTPDATALTSLRSDHTPVRLADHSVVEATHKGLARLPIEGGPTLKTLVVPSLHEPLLSVAGICDAGFTVIFTKSSCDFYKSSDLKLNGTMAGRGYRRGNLFYLAPEPF